MTVTGKVQKYRMREISIEHLTRSDANPVRGRSVAE
jgi:hypothetical protein